MQHGMGPLGQPRCASPTAELGTALWAGRARRPNCATFGRAVRRPRIPPLGHSGERERSPAEDQ